MDQYTYLDCMISQLLVTGVFSKKLLDQLMEELEQAHNDGRLDDDPNYAPDEIFLCELNLK